MPSRLKKKSHPFGKVYLLGAGPGSPDLITVRGKETLAQADVVVYDHLAREALVFAPQAEKIYAGKKGATGEKALAQEEIEVLLVRMARRGKRVVRLKGGDPFIFGRGGEEILYLSKHKIPFEIVPGITAAVAAAAEWGIPLTHRDFASQLVFVTGHEKEEAGVLRKETNLRLTIDNLRLAESPCSNRRSTIDNRQSSGDSPSIDWPLLAQIRATLVFYMGVKNCSHVAHELMKHGKSPETPACVVSSERAGRSFLVEGNLKNIAGKSEKAKVAPPALIIVGEGVGLRNKIARYLKKSDFGISDFGFRISNLKRNSIRNPQSAVRNLKSTDSLLSGKTILVTRARPDASALSEKLRVHGARVLEFPTIEICPMPSYRSVDREILRLAKYDWLIFTSAHGVDFFMERVRRLGRSVRALAGLRVNSPPVHPTPAERGEERRGVTRQRANAPTHQPKFAVIGPGTEKRLSSYGLKADLVPKRFVSEGLFEELKKRGEIRGRRFLLARASGARDFLKKALLENGAQVREVSLYRTLPLRRDGGKLRTLLQNGGIDYLTFTSSSTVRNFVDLLKPRKMPFPNVLIGNPANSERGTRLDSCLRHAGMTAKIISIGPITSKTLQEEGLRLDAEAGNHTLDGLVEAILKMERGDGD